MEEITLEYVENLADQLPVEDQQTLATNLSNKLRNGLGNATERRPQDLYGTWKTAFSEDLDIDAALYEIRHEWEKGLEELSL
jgi:hypothetical protein